MPWRMTTIIIFFFYFLCKSALQKQRSRSYCDGHTDVMLKINTCTFMQYTFYILQNSLYCPVFLSNQGSRKKKELFFCSQCKTKHILLLGFFLGGGLIALVTEIQNVIWLFQSKNCWECFFCQNPFSAILRLKKFRWPPGSKGGGVVDKALVAGPLEK